MQMKLIVGLIDVNRTSDVVSAAREGGATGSTVITGGRGEGIKPRKTFLGLDLTATCDVVLFLVAKQKARSILELIRDTANFDGVEGSGVAFQLDIEDVVGLGSQMATLAREVEETL